MSETPLSGKRSAGASESENDDRLRLALVAAAILLALSIAAVTLRFQRLSELPPGLLLDEGIHGANALQVLRGEHTVFFPEKDDGLEGLMAYAVALATALLGRTELALRLPAALASTATLFATFWLGYVLFREAGPGEKANPWRGVFIGGLGAGLLAVSLGQTIIGRTALRANFLPLVLSLCFALLWLGWRKSSRWEIIAAGVCAGILPYTYLAARFVPFLFVLFGLSFLPLIYRETKVRQGTSLNKRHLWQICIFAGVALLVAAPILIYFALNPEYFFARSSQVSVFHPSNSQGAPLRILLINVWEHLQVFGIAGDRYWRYNFPGQPMLNMCEGLFFWLGVGIALSQWRKPALRLLFLWLVVLLMPAMLARDSVPHTLRMIGAMPAIYLLAAVGAWETLQFLGRMFPRKVKTWTAIGIGTLIAALLVLKGLDTHRLYFHDWAAAPEIYNSSEVEWTELVRTLNAQPPSTSTIYLIPDGQRRMDLEESYQNYIFDYLYQNTTPVLLFHTAMPDLARKIETTIRAMEIPSDVRLVEWDFKPVWTGDEDERIAVLLGKYGRLSGSDDFDSFRVRSYTDIDLESPWTFYEQLEHLNVQYDGGISLLGAAYGQGQMQFKAEELLNLGEDPNMWVALQWITGPDLGINYSFSLRLHDEEGASVYQMDTVLWKPNHTLTGSGGPSTQFDTVFPLQLPAELPPGEYEMRLVVYDSESLNPTVELGVWEPELTLVRLRIATAQ